MSEDPVLLCNDRNGVLTLTLNRPRRKNAINRDLWIALAEALTAAGNDRGVRALVITGAGGAFCSGADISTPDDSHPVHKLQRLTDVALALALHELPVPTIAKVNGVAVGAVWNLALGCDLVAATPESTFSQIFTKRGLSVDLGDRRCGRGLYRVRRAARAVVDWSMGGIEIGAEKCVKRACDGDTEAAPQTKREAPSVKVKAPLLIAPAVIFPGRRRSGYR